MKLSVSIMSVPERRHAVIRQAKQLGLPLGDDGVRVAWDVDKKGPGDNAKLAWSLHDPEATHHILLQDDVWFPPNLLDHVARAVEAVPDECISLFTARWTKSEAAYKRGKAWFADSNWHTGGGGQGFVMPVEWIPRFRAWDVHPNWQKAIESGRILAKDTMDDDVRLPLWLTSIGRRVWATVPSLVEHIGIGKSLLGHSNKAGGHDFAAGPWYIGDAPRNPDSIDWTSIPKVRRS